MARAQDSAAARAEDAEDRSFVTALARGLEVLGCFRAGETALTNQEIALRTGLPKPTVSRLTHTLRRLGYLTQPVQGGAYHLGAGVLTLGYGVLAGMEIGDLAREEMRALCDGPSPHVTAALGERHRLKMIYTAVRRSGEAVSLTLGVGARLPLFHSAMGRAVLAGMPEGERARLLAQAIAEKPQDEAAIRAGLDEALESYARHGFCTSFGGWRHEINGIAVPIASLGDDRLYGLNVGGPSFLVSPEMLIGDYGARLLAAGRALDRRRA